MNGSEQWTFPQNGSLAPDAWFANFQDDLRFGVTALPYNETLCGVGNTGGCRGAILGGSVLAISAFSANKDAAKLWLKEVASRPFQTAMVMGEGNAPTLKSIYEDGDLNGTASEFLNDFFVNIFPHVLPRPVHKEYASMSSAIQPIFHAALSGNKDIPTALTEMDDEVNLILNPPGISVTTIVTTDSVGSTITSEITVTTSPGFNVLVLLGSLGTLALVFHYRRKKK